MCGRYTLTSFDDLDVAFGLAAAPPPAPPRYNIAPGQMVPIIRNQPARVLAPARWGLVPSWARDPAIGNKMINARAETAADKPAFRDALRKRRCLVVADGFYEWQRPPGGPGSRGARGKTPHYVRRTAREPFGMAGLWERWQAPDGTWLETCTILTGDANELMAPIHDRMPIILVDRADRDRWLAPEPVAPAALRDLLQPPPARGFEAYPVSSMVNAPQTDAPGCIEPATPAARPRPAQRSLFDPGE